MQNELDLLTLNAGIYFIKFKGTQAKEMVIFRRLLIVVFVFYLGSLQATNYYVDSSNGDDSHNGTSPSMAWQTISKVIAMSSNFQAGDSILFKRGEIWNGERINTSTHPSGNINNPITYGSYGSGARPIINIHTDQFPEWTDEGDNIWSTLISAGSRFFKNGIEMLRASDISLLGLYGTEYHVGFINNGEDYQLSVYSTVDPSINTYTWSPSSTVVSLYYADYINFIDIDFQGGASSSIRIYDNIGWKIINCNVGWNAGGGIKIRNTSNVIIDSVIFDSNFTVDMSLLPQGTSDYTGCNDGIFVSTGSTNITVRNCFFKNWGHASFSSNTTESLNVVSDISFHNNELTSPDILHGGRIGYSGYSEDGEYFNNYIHNIRAQNQLGGSRNHFHHNIIDSVLHSPIEYYVYAKGVSLSNYNVQIKDNIIENNVIANTDGKGMEIYSINFDYPGEVSGNILRNNILFNCGTLVDDIAVQFHEDSIGQLIFNNTMENNLIYSSSTIQTCMYQYNGTITDVATFNSLNTNIHDNLSDNPLFVDAANSDYHLLANSPAIDAGTIPLSLYDYDGNPIPNGDAADIGAFEYYGSVGIEDATASDIIIYPNPVSDKLFLSNELLNKDYDIISLTGIIVKSGKIDKNEIDLTELKSGIYFIQIKENTAFNTRIIKLMKK